MEQEEDWALCFRDERNRKARESYHKRKEALNTPIEWHEEYEMSEYEKIRERIIKEREDALAAAGFSWKLK